VQTILGANGQIGTELARALHDEFTTDIRLVSRHPKSLHSSDQTLAANLLDRQETDRAVAGSEIAYLTVGLPPDARMWAEQLPIMMTNVIDACAKHGTKLVFFDNTYMYPKTAAPQTESTPFQPVGSKAVTRAKIATKLLRAMDEGRVQAVICRAPEFYGPGKTQSFTNTLVLDRIAQSSPARVPLTDDTRRTLIWTPDASRAMAVIGNASQAYGQTWHLPVDSERPTYRELIDLCSEAWGRHIGYRVMKAWQFRLAGIVSRPVREIWELLPRYAVDNIFVADKFTAAFPEFRVTSYREGIAALAAESRTAGAKNATTEETNR
jgi:nucleoside-diphosphate-sugar epimerase